jgi:hypothetical protein
MDSAHRPVLERAIRLYPLDPAHDVDALTSHIADFFQRGRKEL